MADQAAAGRGEGDSKSGKKLKFAPTVPSRRKKADDGAGGSSAADAAAANEAFQDLIRAAQSESKWERGRGRGFGRGRGMMGAQNVTFGGGDDSGRRPTGVAPPPARIPGIKQLVGSSSSAAASATKKELKSKLKSDPSKTDNSKAASRGLDHGGDASSDEDDGPANVFDFSQYYPTSLPFSLHPPNDPDADPDADYLMMRQGVPQDLALRQDDPENTVQQLGLSDLSAVTDLLYLFQLPAALPLAAAAKQDAADQQRGKRVAAAAAAANGSSTAAVGLQRAAGIKELPSGKLGKLLLFQSGKVKMQIGDVLLDVSAGVPCVTRQDVAAINASAKMLVNLGTVTQRAVVCPDVWQLMADQKVPEWQRAASVEQRQLLGGAAEAAADHAQLHAAAAAAAAANGKAASSDESDSMDVDSDDQQQGGDGDGQPDGKSEEHRFRDDEDGNGAGKQGTDNDDESSGSSSSEDDSSSAEDSTPSAAAAAAVKHKPSKGVAAAAVAATQDDEVMSLLGLPTAAAAAGGGSRGRGRFRPAATRPTRGEEGKQDGCRLISSSMCS